MRRPSSAQDPGIRNEGKDFPFQGETMIGLKRLDQLHRCIEEVVRHKIPGDFIECGVWRGGATILMRRAAKILWRSWAPGLGG